MSTRHKSILRCRFCQATRTGALTCLSAVGGPCTKSDSKVLRQKLAGARLAVLIAVPVQRRMTLALVTVRRTCDLSPVGILGRRMVSSELASSPGNASCVYTCISCH